MPHFTIEYSANIKNSVSWPDLCEAIRSAAVETGVFPLGGIRVRAYACEAYAIADGAPEHAFVAMVLRLGQGRDPDTRKTAGERVFQALADHLAELSDQRPLAISFDMEEISSEFSFKKNTIHQWLQTKENP